MAAQDFDALYNFEDQIETAIAAVLVAALAAGPTPIACQVLTSRDFATKQTPRLEVEFATGKAMNQRTTAGQANPRQVPSAFEGTLTVSVVTDRQTEQSVAVHGILRGRARFNLSAAAQPFTSINIPNLQILDMLPANTVPGMQTDKEEDITAMSYSVMFGIQNNAWPSYP